MTPRSYSLLTKKFYHTFAGEFCKDLLKDENHLFVYAGFVEQNFLTLDAEQISYLRETIRHSVNDDTRIIFDCIGEGIAEPMLRILHQIVDDNLNHENVYYITSSLNIDEIYNRMEVGKRINLRVVSTWESYMRDQVNYTKPYMIKEKDKPFVCFNRVARSHRLALFGLMLDNGLVDKSYYSYLHSSHGYENPIEAYLNTIKYRYSAETSDRIHYMINQNRSRIPLQLNIDPNENATYIKDSDYEYFENSYFSLVTETLFDEPDGTIFFSEKIFKPIALKHPFILVSVPGSLQKLRDCGYRTFDKIIDETYDTINNHEQRLLSIVAEVERISKNTPEQWIDWQNEAKEIVEYNHQVLRKKTFKDFIYGRYKT